MNENEIRKISKRLSLVLRHQPESVHITLDPQGWVAVAHLLLALGAKGVKITPEQLKEVVVNNDKNRFEFSSDNVWIRARQGHSVSVDLGYETAVPPDILYHGTASQFVEAILEDGLDKRKRHDVHMSTDVELMRTVGRRRGQPVILRINARGMYDAGHEFRLTGNEIWQTSRVPPAYIAVCD